MNRTLLLSTGVIVDTYVSVWKQRSKASVLCMITDVIVVGLETSHVIMSHRLLYPEFATRALDWVPSYPTPIVFLSSIEISSSFGIFVVCRFRERFFFLIRRSEGDHRKVNFSHSLSVAINLRGCFHCFEPHLFKQSQVTPVHHSVLVSYPT